MIDRDARHLGLAWEPALTNGFIHDGRVESITHPTGLRDVTVSIRSPWCWNRRDIPLPAGATHDQISGMRLIFRFKDVTHCELTHQRVELDIKGEMESRSSLKREHVSLQNIYLWSRIDEESAAIQTANEAHGGRFRSARMELLDGCAITLIFRDCLCVPSSWVAYEVWSAYPFESGTQVPPVRSEPLVTGHRYVYANRRRVCTTRLTGTFTPSLDTDTFYLCDSCLDEWVADHFPQREIPHDRNGSGYLVAQDDNGFSWERGRFPAQECNCQVRRFID